MCVEGISPPCDPEIIDDDCCGNQIVDDLEECDPGPYVMDDTGPCTTKCKNAVCGDGFVQTNVEACDGGDQCTPACTLKSCGNGVVDPGEWCEPRGANDPECTHLCADGQKIIFVSSVHYKGGEIGSVQGGILGADGRCQELAVNAGLVGTFRAWLATSEDDAPLVRFNWLEGQYVDVNGNVIAETWDKVYHTYGVLPPNVTEYGLMVTDSELTWPWMNPVVTHLLAWATPIDGPSLFNGEALTCGGWNDVDELGSAALLDHHPDIPNGASKQFVVQGYKDMCTRTAPIICVEQ